MYYDCASGCVTHEQCTPGVDGLPKVFDEVYEWCDSILDVDCGSRPCVDEVACSKCKTPLPSGGTCGPTDFFAEPDPEVHI